MPRALELINQNIPASTAKPVQTPAKTVSTTPAPTAKPIATTKAPVKLSDYSINEVIIMQNIIISLSNTMVKNAEFISKEIEVLTKEDVINYATSFQKMGRINNAPTDGVWGPNTNKVLTNINSFLYRIGSNLKVEIGPGEYPFKGDQEELKKLAINNLNVINSVFGEIGVEKPSIKETSKKVNIGDFGELDRIKQTLSMNDARDPNSYGDVIVLPKDLEHLGSFYLFIQGLNADWFTVCKPLNKYLPSSKSKKQEQITTVNAALEILNCSIYKLAQEEPKTIEEQVIEAPETNGVCFGFLDGVLSWFIDRSRTIYNASKTDKDKLALAEKYQFAVRNLKAQWMIIRPYIIEQIKSNGLEGNPKISDEMFMHAGERLHEDKQSGNIKKQLIDSRDETGYTQESGRTNIFTGPIQPSMNLDDVSRRYAQYMTRGTQNLAERLRSASYGGVLPVITNKNWSNSANWKNIAHRVVDAPTLVEQERGFVNYANMLKDFLTYLLDNWQHNKDISSNISMDLKENQDSLLYNWLGYIDRLIREARYDQRHPEGTQERKWSGAF
jgi:hypothetical protein